ncbi:hypothetical protein AALA21_07390 [Eggerthellaceae bacterium 3-80]|nr:hypothetical protein D7W09_06865 [bacterium D16-34]
MAIFFGVVVLVGVIAWGIVRTDELSGLGRNASQVSFRNPHGALVSTSCEHLPEKQVFGTSLRQALPWITFAICIIVTLGGALLSVLGTVSVGMALMQIAASVAPALLIAFESYLRIRDKGTSWVLYVLILLGAVVGGALFGMPLFWLFTSSLSSADMSVWLNCAYCLVSDFGYTLGAGFAGALIGYRVKFSRTFEDGTTDTVEVSCRSVAYKALCERLDTQSEVQ